MSSPTGPAEHCAGGSRAKSLSSLLIRFSAIVCAFRRAPHYPEVYSKVRPKFLIIPAAGKGCLFFSHRLCQTQAQRAGASLELRPRPPPRAAAGASPALRGSRARHSHKMSALTELLPAATLRPSPRLFTAAYPSANAAVASAGRAEGFRGERFASLARAEWTCRPLAVSLSEQHLLAKAIGGRAGRAGDGGGSWAEGEGRRVAETLKFREASRTGRRP